MLYNRVLLNDFPIRLTMIDSHPAQEGLENLDSQAVTAVYNQYFPEVFRYIRYRLGDDALAEDISSDVFFSLLKAVKSRRAPAVNVRGWLIGTARHMIIDHLRREYRHPSQAISDALESDRPGLPEQVEGRLASQALHLALIQLTEDQQQVLALRFGQGYSLEETAAMMKKKINAVKALQFRALNALQRVIGEVK
jgi:RNA polymerase sigma-70 factor (ECF subfamily)